MAKFEFKLNKRDFEQSLKRYPEDLVNELRKSSKRSASTVEQGAKQSHRFTTRTGRLVKSIKGYGGVTASVPSKGFLGRLKELLRGGKKVNAFVELVLHDEGHPLGTEYGKYVHEGQRSWSPDKFIESSMDRNKRKILEGWNKAISIANRKF